MGPIVLVAVIVFTVINLIIYHKIFDVYYFGSGAMLKEIVGAFILAMVEVGVVMQLGSAVLGVIVTAIVFIVKLALIILAIIAVLIIIAVIISLISGNREKIKEFFSRIKEKLHINNKEAKDLKTSDDNKTSNDENKNSDMEAPLIQKTNEEHPKEEKMIQCNTCGKYVPYKASACKYCKAVIRNNENIL